MGKSTFIMLYKSLVRPHLEYANSVWSGHPTKKVMLRVSRRFRKEQLN